MQAETAEKAVNEALSKIQPAKRILKQAQNYKENLKAANDLFGGNFGYGIGVFINGGANERVKNAEIKGGVVKVTNSADISVGALLETHYLAKIRDLLILVPGEKAAAYAKTLENESLPEFGVGPFGLTPVSWRVKHLGFQGVRCCLLS